MAEYDAAKKLWGKLDEKQIKAEKVSLGQSILDLLKAHGPKIAQINDDTGVRTTFEVVRLKTIRVAQHLQKMGFKPRQRFSFMTKNCDDLLPVYLASICLACPIVPFYALLSEQEIYSILKKTQPNIMFCDAASYTNIIAILNDLKLNIKVLTFGDHINGAESVQQLLLETGDEHNFVPIDIDVNDDIAGIFCSSGTTGPSKGVCVGFDHAVFTSLNKYVENSKIFDVHSIYWTVGIKLIMESIHNGATRIITSHAPSPDFQLHLIEKYKINVLNPVPYDVVSFLKHEKIQSMDLSSVTSICTYGYKMPPNLLSDVRRHFPNSSLISSYGLTEIGQVACCYFDRTEDKGGLRLINNCLVKIIDDDNNQCGPKADGEIRVKNNYKFRGYFHDPIGTADALDEENFFRTGDVGHFDDNGILFFSDRKKNILTVFYFDGWLLPDEVESCLLKVSDIKEVCVVGIPIITDAKLPAAVIVRKPGSKITQNEVYNVVAESFPERCQLRGGIYFVDSLPKTHNGKLIRSKVTTLATEQFKLAKHNDADVKKYLSDIPESYRKYI